MTNADKAKAIGKSWYNAKCCGVPMDSDKVAEQAALEMAEWKEQWFMKWLTCNAKFYNKYGCEIDIDTDTLIKDFKQAMTED